MLCSDKFFRAWKQLGWIPSFDFKIEYEELDDQIALEGGLAPATEGDGNGGREGKSNSVPVNVFTGHKGNGK